MFLTELFTCYLFQCSQVISLLFRPSLFRTRCLHILLWWLRLSRDEVPWRKTHLCMHEGAERRDGRRGTQDLRGRNPCPSPSQGCPSSPRPRADSRRCESMGPALGSTPRSVPGGCHCPGVRSTFWAAREGRFEAALAGEKVKCVGSRVRVRGAPDGVWSRRTQAASLITAVDHLSVGSNSRSDWWELRSNYPSLVIVTLDNYSQYCFLNSFIIAFLNLSRPSFSNLFYDDVRW